MSTLALLTDLVAMLHRMDSASAEKSRLKALSTKTAKRHQEFNDDFLCKMRRSMRTPSYPHTSEHDAALFWEYCYPGDEPAMALEQIKSGEPEWERFGRKYMEEHMLTPDSASPPAP